MFEIFTEDHRKFAMFDVFTNGHRKFAITLPAVAVAAVAPVALTAICIAWWWTVLTAGKPSNLLAVPIAAWQTGLAVLGLSETFLVARRTEGPRAVRVVWIVAIWLYLAYILLATALGGFFFFLGGIR